VVTRNCASCERLHFPHHAREKERKRIYGGTNRTKGLESIGKYECKSDSLNRLANIIEIRKLSLILARWYRLAAIAEGTETPFGYS